MCCHALVLPLVLLMASAEETAKDVEKLQGTWIAVEAVKAGKSAPEDRIKNMKIIIERDTLTVTEGRGHDEKAKFKLDPAQQPKTIDVIPDGEVHVKLAPGQKPPAVADKSEKAALGIYELDGDTLRLCWRKQGGERPTKFASVPEDPASILLVLKRAKPEK